MVQVVRLTVMEKGTRIVYKFKRPRNPTFPEQQRQEWLRNDRMTDETSTVQAGWHVDDFPGYGAARLARFRNSSSGKGNSHPAFLNDEPGDQLSLARIIGDRYEFETCAVCADDCTVLGCLMWGFEYAEVTHRERGHYASTTVMVLAPCTASKIASANFHAAIDKYNQFHNTNIKFTDIVDD